jgi:hypothetical protein
MTNTEAEEIFQAGQRLLEALHPHYDERKLEYFDQQLGVFYDQAGLAHKLCEQCGADTPVQLLKDDECPKCSA